MDAKSLSPDGSEKIPVMGPKLSRPKRHGAEAVFPRHARHGAEELPPGRGAVVHDECVSESAVVFTGEKNGVHEVINVNVIQEPAAAVK